MRFFFLPELTNERAPQQRTNDAGLIAGDFSDQVHLNLNE